MSDPVLGGRLKFFVDIWKKYTTDKFILECIEGIKIKFVSDPILINVLREIKCSDIEKMKIDVELQIYLDKGIVRKATHCEGEVISQIFSRPKKTGGDRVILNLKNLNCFVQYI